MFEVVPKFAKKNKNVSPKFSEKKPKYFGKISNELFIVFSSITYIDSSTALAKYSVSMSPEK